MSKHISPIFPLTNHIYLVTDPFNVGALYRSDDGYIPKKVLDRETKRALRWSCNILAKKRTEEQNKEVRAIINGGKQCKN